MIPILATVLLTWALCMPLHFYGKKQKNKVLSLVFKALPTIMAAMFAEYLPPVLTAFGLTALAVLGLPPLLRAGYRRFPRNRSNAETKDELP